jgi:hypothetical protein
VGAIFEALPFFAILPDNIGGVGKANQAVAKVLMFDADRFIQPTIIPMKDHRTIDNRQETDNQPRLPIFLGDGG